MAIDYSRRKTSASLKRAHSLIGEAYRILCDEVGATNPADNQFLRESVICARARLIWAGERGGTDARSRNGEDVEIKTTRLDPKARQKAKKAFQNNPKIPLSRLHGIAHQLVLARGYRYEQGRLLR